MQARKEEKGNGLVGREDGENKGERGWWAGGSEGKDGDQVIWRKRAGGGEAGRRGGGWREGAEGRGGGEDERCERHGSSASPLWLARDCRIS